MVAGAARAYGVETIITADIRPHYLDAAREINARGGPAGPGELVSTPTAGEAEGFDRPEEN